jgi:hypothetical protein
MAQGKRLLHELHMQISYQVPNPVLILVNKLCFYGIRNLHISLHEADEALFFLIRSLKSDLTRRSIFSVQER